MDTKHCKIISGPSLRELSTSYEYRVVSKFSIEIDGEEAVDRCITIDGLIPKDDEDIFFFINGLAYHDDILYRFYGGYDVVKRTGYMDFVKYR